MSLPEHYVNYLSQYDPPWLGPLIQAMNEPPAVAVRYNPRKRAVGLPDGRLVAWCDEGRLLPERIPFTFDPSLHQGAYYVQDPSSMFVGYVARQLVTHAGRPLTVLDACAAPGGKSTALIDALPDGSHLVANEFVAKRVAVLRENLAKWGYPMVCVTQGDTSRFRLDTGMFDIVAADVPCSGEGMMRKDAVAVEQWTSGLVTQCVALQREIVDNLWPALKPGGYMIYSTCTFNPEENENMLRYLREEYGAEPVTIDCTGLEGIAPQLMGDMPACRFIPGLIEGEGLFMGVVRKPISDNSPIGHAEARKPRRLKRATAPRRDKRPSLPAGVNRWIKGGYAAEIYMDEGKVWANFTPGHPYPAQLLIGEMKGRDVVPSQQLALSSELNMDAFPCVEVDESTAIGYLRCEALTLPNGTPHGVVLLTYGGLPLGFAKNIGNRANNLYPRSWRILSQPR